MSVYHRLDANSIQNHVKKGEVSRNLLARIVASFGTNPAISSSRLTGRARLYPGFVD